MASASLEPISASLGFHANAHEHLGSFGEQIAFPCQEIPDSTFHIGEWDGFSDVLGILNSVFNEKLEYEFFPEAVGDPSWIKPEWAACHERIEARLNQIIALETQSLAPPLAFEDDFRECVECLLVMSKTIEYVLKSSTPEEFLLYWSA